MSGGSFDYLCFMEVEQLMNNKDLLDKMANRLLELGYKDAAKETFLAKIILEQTEIRIEVIKERLEKVWKAIEWMDSGDSGIDEVDEAIKNYRGEDQ